MTGFAITLAAPRDAAAVTAVLEAAYAPWRAAVPDLPDVTGGAAEAIADGAVWLAAGDQVFGVLFLRSREDGMLLENLAVHPSSAGMGLGAALLSHAEAQARAAGAARISLRTHPAFAPAKRLYERAGWRQTEAHGQRVTYEKLLAPRDE